MIEDLPNQQISRQTKTRMPIMAQIRTQAMMLMIHRFRSDQDPISMKHEKPGVTRIFQSFLRFKCFCVDMIIVSGFFHSPPQETVPRILMHKSMERYSTMQADCHGALSISELFLFHYTHVFPFAAAFFLRFVLFIISINSAIKAELKIYIGDV